MLDLFAEWTTEYQTREGKQAIMAGSIVFDCWYCQKPLQLVLPLALTLPQKPAAEYQVARRSRQRCGLWLSSQHPGQSLSQVVESADWRYNGVWAFDGYVWSEGAVHRHGQDAPPAAE